MVRPRLLIVAAIIVAAAVSRLIPHPPNLASVTAVALFAGAYVQDRRLAFLIPLVALFLGDLILGFYGLPEMLIVYGSFALIVCIGLWLKQRRSALRIGGGSIASSVLFFVLTNFGTWAFSSIYPKTLAGLMACYIAAIPFFQNTIQGDLLYTLVLFGGFALLERRFSRLREPGPAGALAA